METLTPRNAKPKKIFCKEKKFVINELKRIIDVLDNMEAKMNEKGSEDMKMVATNMAATGVEMLTHMQQDSHLLAIEAIAYNLYGMHVDMFLETTNREEMLESLKQQVSTVVVGGRVSAEMKEKIFQERLKQHGKRID